MEESVFSNKEIHPSEDLILSHLRLLKPIWIELFHKLHQDYPDIIGEWKYYNDGKSWLQKNSYKKKTMFWLSVQKDSFRTTFYLNEKAASAIAESNLPAKLKDQFINGKRFNKIRGLTIQFKRKSDIKHFFKVLEIKLRVT